MAEWQRRLAGLLGDGVEAGQFRIADVEATGMRVLALIDGMSVQAAIPQRMSYQRVRDMVMRDTERELGLPVGSFEV